MTSLPTTYDLTIGISGNGITNPEAKIHSYDKDSTVMVLATPDSGWKFDHWELDGVPDGSDLSYNVTMDANKVVTAFFRDLP